MVEEEKDTTADTPSSFLRGALNQYCHELEALRNSLGSVMSLFDELHRTHHEEVEKFIDDHGQDTTKDEEGYKFILDHEKKKDFDKLNRAVLGVRSSRRLMPRNFVVALICTYDSFLGKILRYLFMVRPAILDSSDRTLKYSDLLGFADIPAAREHLVEKEVESVLRKSHADHFAWLQAKLATPFNKNLRSWPDFVELSERRNLFVHTDGVVSSQYLQVCREHKCQIPEDLTVGKRLGAPPEYFANAFKCLYEIGFKLAHVIWRKLEPGDLESIDSHLIEQTFSLIEIGEYEVAARILEFFTQDQIKHENESTKRVLCINLAQCYKWQDKGNKCREVLDRFDWSATEDRFKIAEAVLKDDYERALALMRRLKHDESFLKKYYKEWPLFQGLRRHEGFRDVYLECYGEEFKIEEGLAHETRSENETEEPKENYADKLDSGSVGGAGLATPVMNGHDQTHQKEDEHGGAGQPATRSESDSGGDDKPQPESKGRSR